VPRNESGAKFVISLGGTVRQTGHVVSFLQIMEGSDSFFILHAFIGELKNFYYENITCILFIKKYFQAKEMGGIAKELYARLFES
jgi:hypothetical protein